MKRIPPVEYAKELMTEAHDWSLWRWLLDKGRVRRAADDANAALLAAEQKVISEWNEPMRRAYAELSAQESGGKKRQSSVDPEVMAAVLRIKEALDEAERVRLNAEDTFDEADRRLSTDLAREGTAIAIQAWTMREKAIRKAEAAGK